MVYAARRLADDGHNAWEIVKQRGYEDMAGADPESVYRGEPSPSWLKVELRREGAFVIGGVLETEDGGFVALVGERDGDGPAFRGTVEYGFARAAATDVLTKTSCSGCRAGRRRQHRLSECNRRAAGRQPNRHRRDRPLTRARIGLG